MNLSRPSEILWHESLSTRIKSPSEFREMGRSTKDTTSDAMVTAVESGYIQSLIAHLPDHLRNWGHLCFSPDDMRPWNAMELVANALEAEFLKRRTITDERKEKAKKLCDMAIIYMVEMNRTREVPKLSKNQIAKYIGVKPSHFALRCWQDYFNVMVAILSLWTGEALKPISDWRNNIQSKAYK